MLVNYTDQILKQPAARFDFNDPPVDPIELAHELAKAMMEYGGIGLAANQLGYPYRVFAIHANPILVCYNPVIVDKTSASVTLDEACLTFPGLSVKVKRPESIKVRYTEPNGNTVTTKFTGMSARIFQHEYDHLEGLTMLDACNFMERERAKKRWKLLCR